MFYAKTRLAAALLASVCLTTAAGVTTYRALAEEPAGQSATRKAEPLPAGAVARTASSLLELLAR